MKAKNWNRVARTQALTSIFMAVAIFGVTMASVGMFSNGMDVSNYKTLHFVLNYEVEFLKRGLAGEAFRLLGISPWGPAPAIFHLIVLLLLSGVYLLAALKILHQKAEPVLVVILIALWTSPAALPHLAVDFGRLDAFLILLLGLWATCSLALGANQSFALLALTGCTTMLIHELALFTTVPIGLALWLIRYDERLLSAGTFAFAVLISAAFALIWAFGNADVMTSDQITQTISQKFGIGDYSIDLMHLVLFGDISENIAFSAKQAPSFSTLSEHLKFLGIMSGYLLLHGAILRVVFKRLPGHAWIATVACMAPFALYPLGFDYFRWLSFVLTNMTALSLWVMLHDPAATDAIITRCKGWRRSIQAVALLVLMVGPLGVFTAFSLGQFPVLNLILP